MLSNNSLSLYDNLFYLINIYIMIGLITTTSTVETQPLVPKLQLIASHPYLIQTNNITNLRVHGSADSLVEYALNVRDDRLLSFEFIVDETNAAIQALADVTKENNTIPLGVFENSLNFADIANDTAVTRYVNVDDIVWGEDDADNAYSRLVLQVGGFDLEVIFVDYNIYQVIDVADTGTTTTTTTSTTEEGHPE